MSSSKRKIVLSLLVVGLVFLIPASVFSRLCANGSSGGYTTGDGGTGDKVVINNAIEMYVIEGANYYLKAYSGILLFLSRVEESDTKGWNYSEAQQVLDAALDNMTKAVNAYSQLIRRAEMTPYNGAAISKLMDFDYPGFMKKWRLNPAIFEKVEAYLAEGDITGMYRHMYTDFLTMKRMLNRLQGEISPMRMPELSVLWGLNEYCSQTMVFGQYVSRIFYAILDANEK